MNVLMVTSSYPKFPGDVTAPFIESIAHGVAARGHRVDVVLPHHPDLRRSDDEPVRFLPLPLRAARRLERCGATRRAWRPTYAAAPAPPTCWPPWWPSRCAAPSARGCRTTRYDVVHAHWVVPNATLVDDIAARARRRPWW